MKETNPRDWWFFRGQGEEGRGERGSNCGDRGHQWQYKGAPIADMGALALQLTTVMKKWTLLHVYLYLMKETNPKDW